MTKVRLNSDLAELCEPRIDLGERIFKHFATLRELGILKLVEDPQPGEEHKVALALPGELLRSQLHPVFIHRGGGFCLLILNRLAFPASRHE